MVALDSVAFAVAVICAALMGYAIQRGATCTVAAVAEIAHDGTAKRLVALAEAALWVAGGLLVARALGLTADLPSGFSTTGWTILGATLLGIGAYTNGACVFGAIARFGSGDWAYALTPLGFYLGALSMSSLFPGVMPAPTVNSWSFAGWLALVFAVFVAWRVFGLVRKIRTERRVAAHVWAPHEATIVIAVAFVIMFVGVGAWAYMDILVQLAHGMTDNLGWRLILFGALLGGAMVGGWTAGKLSNRLPSLPGVARCLAGGTLMGWGSALIPGSNDGLILIGLPLLMPYAWVAMLTMAVTIWVAILMEKRLMRRQARV
jgi:Sulphur transport